MRYFYNTNSGGRPLNQLNHINDLAGNNGVGEMDTSQYVHDAIEQLAQETSRNQGYRLRVVWTPWGKVDSVIKYDTVGAGSIVLLHTYIYDAMGNQVKDHTGGTQNTYSIYDANSTKLASYSIQTPVFGSNTMGVDERYIYGSDRLATLKGSDNYAPTFGPIIRTHNFAQQYELKDHLGNVRATIDLTAPSSTGIKDVSSYFNYYAFGSPHSSRSFNSSVNYSFGFNGQEKKDDYLGAGNENHALYWEYGTREGVRWNRDPVVNHSISPYAVFDGSPIAKNDPNGDCTDCPSKAENGNKYEETANGYEAEDIEVKAAKPASNASFNGTSGDYNIAQAAKEGIGRNDENRRKADMRQNAVGAVMAIGGAAAVAPMAIAEIPLFAVSTELWGTKALLSAGSQGLVNGWSEIDIADVAGDAFTAPGLNGLWGGGVDFKPFAKQEEDKFRIQFLHNPKTFSQFSIDATIGFSFGYIGDIAWKPLSPLLKAPIHKSIFYLSTQPAFSIGQQGAGKIASDQQTSK